MPRLPGFAPTVLLGLAGAGLAAVAGGQTWATATVTAPAVRTAAASGADVAPLGLPLALLALVAWAAVLLLRRRGKRVAAVVGLLAAVATGATVLTAAGSSPEVAAELLGAPGSPDGPGGPDSPATTTTAWPVAGLVGALLSAAAFLVAVRGAARWPELSRRYDPPGGAAGDAERSGATDLWRALDEGRDPTA